MVLRDPHVPFGCQRIDFIKEHDAGGGCLRTLKHLPDRALALPHVLVQQLRALDGDEVCAALVGNGLGYQGLSTPGRAEALKPDGNDRWFKPSGDFTDDRRTQESTQSAYVQYQTDWEWGVPMGAALGLRYESTTVKSQALVPIATGIQWVSANEFAIIQGNPGSAPYTHLTPPTTLRLAIAFVYRSLPKRTNSHREPDLHV